MRKEQTNSTALGQRMSETHLLVWLRCLSVRLRGGLHRRVHGGGGVVGGRGVLVPRGERGVVAQVTAGRSGLRRAGCGRKGEQKCGRFTLEVKPTE